MLESWVAARLSCRVGRAKTESMNRRAKAVLRKPNILGMNGGDRSNLWGGASGEDGEVSVRRVDVDGGRC